MMTEPKELWTTISDRIRERISADWYERWFAGVETAT